MTATNDSKITTTSITKHLQDEAERQGEYYRYPDGRVRYVLSNQSLERVAEDCGASVHDARLAALATGIVII